MNEALSKFLDKIPTDKLYTDLFQPGLKKAGIALETVIDFGNTILLPLKLANEVTKLRLSQHLKDYEKKLADIPEEDIHKVPEYIGNPILDKLLLLDSNDLSDAFINLLAKASTSSTLGLVHPAFVQALENLSVDEAKILFHYKEFERIPFISANYKKYRELIKKPEGFDNPGPKTANLLKQMNAYAFQDREEVIIQIEKNLTSIGKLSNLDFKDNIDIYLNNIYRLGIIEFIPDKYFTTDNDLYEELENDIHKEDIENYKTTANEYDKDNYRLEYFTSRGYIEFSQYGKAFLNACVKPITKDD
jgi:hypothetical protein